MAVTGPNEWSELVEWLRTRVVHADLADFDDRDRGRLARALTAVLSGLDGDAAAAASAAEVVRGELEPKGSEGGGSEGGGFEGGGSARADDVLRAHLAVVLAARSGGVRALRSDGALVVANARQWAECRALADEIAALSPDPAMIAFAGDLRRRADEARRWRWVQPDPWTTGVVALAVLVLPFVGGVIGSAVVAAGGVVVGAGLVFGFVMAHRKRQWVQEAGSVVESGSI
ncbi:hypothetical protein ACIGNX_23375 [Actinosynnema sp. NPDC053489]|uniref:hypothetical protein n=1 Tax=Actinosynnema sp. NPDC053489 TaxID=3363916 RepID=UPI0037C59AD1